MINFKLKHINDIAPAGVEGSLRMSWFWLTDADLWLTFNDTKLYEYTSEALEYFENKPSPYNDYPLARFIEDLTNLFGKINESIPKEFYDLTKDLDLFLNDTKKWLDMYEIDEDRYSDFYFEEYDTLISWTYNRTLDSSL